MRAEVSTPLTPHTAHTHQEVFKYEAFLTLSSSGVHCDFQCLFGKYQMVL